VFADGVYLPFTVTLEADFIREAAHSTPTLVAPRLRVIPADDVIFPELLPPHLPATVAMPRAAATPLFFHATSAAISLRY
jgi:hypothetical protein